VEKDAKASLAAGIELEELFWATSARYTTDVVDPLDELSILLKDPAKMITERQKIIASINHYEVKIKKLTAVS